MFKFSSEWMNNRLFIQTWLCERIEKFLALKKSNCFRVCSPLAYVNTHWRSSLEAECLWRVQPYDSPMTEATITSLRTNKCSSLYVLFKLKRYRMRRYYIIHHVVLVCRLIYLSISRNLSRNTRVVNYNKFSHYLKGVVKLIDISSY